MTLTRAAAEHRIDELLQLRWGLMFDGRCPVCEALIEAERPPEKGELTEVVIRHATECPLHDGDLAERLAEEFDIPLALAWVSRERDGRVLMYLGTVRLSA